MFERRNKLETQEEIWVVAKELLKAATDGFTGGVNHTLEKIVFTEQVRTTCVPAWRQMCSLWMRLLNAEESG